MFSQSITRKAVVLTLGFSILASATGCAQEETPAVAQAPIVAEPGDLRIHDNTDVYKNTDMEEKNNVALVVEGLYREVASSKVRAAAITGNPAVVYAPAKTFLAPTSNQDQNVELMSMLANEATGNHAADGYRYDVIINQENISIDNDKAVLKLEGTAHSVNDEINLVTESNSRDIHLVKENGIWFIDVVKTLS